MERAHLQEALQHNIDAIGAGLMVVAEEFGEFEGANRRIDLLCVDHDARLVVVELKRTEDGGHMELQALRYAAMVSTMTFDDLVGIFGRHLSRRSGSAEMTAEAREQLLAHFDGADLDMDVEEPVISREVRVILVAAGFDSEITTTALWLNDVFGLDIRCVKWTPYRVEGRLLLDVQPVIPLPEAEEFTVQLRRRDTVARATKATRDWTQYVITTPTGSSQPLRKNRAVLEMVHAVVAAGVSPTAVAEILGPTKWLHLDSSPTDDAVVEAFEARYKNFRPARYWSKSPVQVDGHTWLVSNQWGPKTEPTLRALADLAPQAGIKFAPA